MVYSCYVGAFFIAFCDSCDFLCTFLKFLGTLFLFFNFFLFDILGEEEDLVIGVE